MQFPSLPSLDTWTTVGAGVNTHHLAANTACLTPAFSCGPAHFNTASAGVHPKLCHKPGSIQAALMGQHHPKRTPVPGSGVEKHIHQFGCSPNSGLGADTWSDCRACPPTKASQETTQGELPIDIWQMPGLAPLKPTMAPDWPTTTTGTKPCPQQAESTIANNLTEGKSGSAKTVGCTQHI